MHRSGAVMAWNVFKFCAALRGLGSLMIFLVLAIVGVTYYAVVISNYGPALLVGGFDSLVAVAVILLFHALVRDFVALSRSLFERFDLCLDCWVDPELVALGELSCLFLGVLM